MASRSYLINGFGKGTTFSRAAQVQLRMRALAPEGAGYVLPRFIMRWLLVGNLGNLGKSRDGKSRKI
jgi:hypothetical protein